MHLEPFVTFILKWISLWFLIIQLDFYATSINVSSHTIDGDVATDIWLNVSHWFHLLAERPSCWFKGHQLIILAGKAGQVLLQFLEIRWEWDGKLSKTYMLKEMYNLIYWFYSTKIKEVSYLLSGIWIKDNNKCHLFKKKKKNASHTLKVSCIIGRTWTWAAFQSVVIHCLTCSDSRQHMVLYLSLERHTLDPSTSARAVRKADKW